MSALLASMVSSKSPRESPQQEGFWTLGGQIQDKTNGQWPLYCLSIICEADGCVLSYLIHTKVHCSCQELLRLELSSFHIWFFLSGTACYFLRLHFFALIHLPQEVLPDWPSQLLALPGLLQRSGLPLLDLQRCCI